MVSKLGKVILNGKDLLDDEKLRNVAEAYGQCISAYTRQHILYAPIKKERLRFIMMEDPVFIIDDVLRIKSLADPKVGNGYLLAYG